MSRGRRLIPERREAATTLQKAATILAIVCLTCGAVLTISFVLSWFRVIGAGRFKTYYTFRGQDLPSMSIEIFRGKFVYSHNEGWIPDTVRPPPRWQYAWWFAPPQNMQRDGKYRHVQVKLVQPRGLPPLKAFFRLGYYAPSQ